MHDFMIVNVYIAIYYINDISTGSSSSIRLFTDDRMTESYTELSNQLKTTTIYNKT